VSLRDLLYGSGGDRVRRVWNWLKEPGSGWLVLGGLMFVLGLLELFTGGDGVALFAYAVACWATARVSFLEDIAIDRDNILLYLLKQEAERRREKAGMN
jgi:hypothetical protein